MAGGGKAPVAALLEELKLWLRIEDTGEDALLHQLLHAATGAAEAILGWLLIAREVEERGRLSAGVLRLTATPVRELLSVVRQEDGAPVEAVLKNGSVGPALVQASVMRADVRVTFVAGEAADWNGLDEMIRLAVIRLAGHFYAHRDGREDPGIPPAVTRMLEPFRGRRLI
ncbi:MAG: phage head-tail connector protein [Sphingomonadaceae bacterium]